MQTMNVRQSNDDAQLTAWVPNALHQRLKQKAIKERTTMKELLSDAIATYLSRGDMRTIQVTPELAAGWMKRNTNNRALNKQTVLDYSRRMESGEWVLNGQAIVFAKDGSLLDGQHRLQAVIKCGLPIYFDVRFNVEPSAFTTMDDGKKRSPSDVLHLAGFKNYSILAAIATKVLSDNNSLKPGVTTRISNNQVLLFVQDNPLLEDIALHAHKLYKKNRTITTSIYGYFLWLFTNSPMGSSSDALTFWNEYAFGNSVKDGCPINALRNKMIECKLNPQKDIPKKVKNALIIKAWNKWITNEPIVRLQYRPRKEKFPKAL